MFGGHFVVLLFLFSEFLTVSSLANPHLLAVGVSVGGRSGYRRAPAPRSACSGWEDAAAVVCKRSAPQTDGVNVKWFSG